MPSPTKILAGRPRALLALAAALLAAVLALGALAPGVGGPGAALYLLPIALLLAFAISLAAALRHSEAETARRFELSLDLVCIADLDGRIRAVNPAFETALGYRGEELAGRRLAELIHPDERDSAAVVGGGGPAPRLRRCFDRRGEAHWIEWTEAAFPEDGMVYIVARDVTDRRQLETELERISELDPLTGVFNRRRFDEELSARLIDARRHERGGALLLIDMDRFKRINDELGRAAGDLALREVARVLAENTRGSDAVGRHTDGLVARLGGDEFAVLLAEAGPVEAATVGERLVSALEATDLRVEGSPVPLAISVGVAPFDGRRAVAAEELLALADRAMYVVKASGGGGAGQAAPAGRRPGAGPA